MFSKALSAVAATLFLVPQIANGQSAPLSDGVYTRPEKAAVGVCRRSREPRLLAGVRAYPPGVLPPLFTVSQQPAVIQQLAEDPQKLMNPQVISPPVSAELQNAIRQLQQVPEAVGRWQPPTRTKSRYCGSSTSAPSRRNNGWQTCVRYDAARVQADALGRNFFMKTPGPSMLIRARDAVHARPIETIWRLSLRRSQTDTVLLRAAAERTDHGLCRGSQARRAARRAILQIWRNRYGPDQVDDLVFSQSDLAVGGSSVAAMSPERRAEMWQPARDRTGSGNALLPIIRC